MGGYYSKEVGWSLCQSQAESVSLSVTPLFGDLAYLDFLPTCLLTSQIWVCSFFSLYFDNSLFSTVPTESLPKHLLTSETFPRLSVSI